ncbi:MAG: nucleoid occlusion protein [Oscillospiraceae bacterium]|nr:nucleoid occlusion protein [Oscillospiraceae bacterium]
MSTVQAAARYASNQILFLPTRDILPNPHQPRIQFSPDGLQELADSISQHGILQPLTVRRTDRGWELIAGERRLRAAHLAGLQEVPCVSVEVNGAESSILALIENLQRKDLDFLEEAIALARLIDLYQLSQEETARKLGKSQSAIANKLRLLRLSPAVLQLLRDHGFTERHARALLRLPEDLQSPTASYLVERKFTVAQTDELVESILARCSDSSAELPLPEPTPSPRRKTTYVIKDVRIFLNSIQHNISIMRQAGISAVYEKQDTDDSILLTIKIPKHA